MINEEGGALNGCTFLREQPIYTLFIIACTCVFHESSRHNGEREIVPQGRISSSIHAVEGKAPGHEKRFTVPGPKDHGTVSTQGRIRTQFLRIDGWSGNQDARDSIGINSGGFTALFR